MSGYWVKLNDVHVRLDAQTEDDCSDRAAAWYATSHIATCLDNLYDVPSIVDVCDCQYECDCDWTSRDHGD